jgi:heptosyltransferase III
MVKKVLIYRLGSLGDTIVTLPALHVVERAFPHAQRLMLTNIPVNAKAPAAAAVLGDSGLVHGYMDYPLKTRSVGKLARVWWQIVRYRPDIVVYLMRRRGKNSVTRDAWFFRLCGVRRIVGLPVGEDAKDRYDAETGMWESEADWLLRRVESLGGADAGDSGLWDLHLTEAEQEKGRAALQMLAGTPLIACGPGTKMQAKDWGRENWKELLARASRQWRGYGLVLVGAREDTEVSDYAAAGWQGPVLNLCGRLTPRETAAVLQHTELFLGPDSGPMHLAAIGGVPCAIAFAAREARGRWFPAGQGHSIVYHQVECEGCMLNECIEKKKMCLATISVDEMLAAATQAWKNRRKTGATQPA